MHEANAVFIGMLMHALFSPLLLAKANLALFPTINLESLNDDFAFNLGFSNFLLVQLKLILACIACAGQDISDDTEVNLAPPPDDISPNPLPANEQQSIPKTHAVAPAVAERTFSKASAATQHIPSMLHITNSLLSRLLMCLSVLAI